MTVSELNEINSDAGFLESRALNLKNILLLLTLGGAVIVMTWQLFDRYYLEQTGPELFWLRFITLTVYGFNLFAAFARNSAKAFKQHLTAGFYFGSIFCILLTMFTGASTSPYWFGLFFILIGWFVLVPYTYRELILHSLVFFVLFLVGLFVQSRFQLVNYEVAKIIFLYSSILVIGFYAALSRNRSEAETFLINRELKDKNTELSKYLLVLEQAPGSVFIMDNKMNFEYINPGFTQLSGFTKEDLLHKNINDTLYKGKMPESRSGVGQALRDGEKWQGELLTYHKSGRSYWANTIAAPYKDSSGNIEGYIIIQQDITQRKNMELAIRESEILYRTLIEKSLDGVALTQNGKIMLTNQAFCDIFGYTMEEMKQITPEDLLAPEDSERVFAEHYKRMRGELGNSSYMALFLHKSGRRLVIEVNSATVQVNGENASFVSARDISERKAIETALRESEEKYRSVIENATDGIVITQQGKLMFVNQSMCGMLKYEESELIQKPFLEFTVEEDRQVMIDFHRRRMAGEDFTSLYQSRLIRKDGVIITVELNARTSDYNGSPAAFIIIRDISERKAMEDALHKSEDRFHRMIQSLQEGLFVIQEEKFIFVNEAIVDILGYTVEEMTGRSFYDVMPPEKREYMVNRHGDRKNGEKGSWSYEYTLLHKDGVTRVPVILSTNLTEFDGKMAIVGTAKDISERVAAEIELRNAHTRLEEINHKLENTIADRTRELTEANTQLLKLQKENLQSQFDVLKQQVNPHFLFNSLNVLTSLIRLEPELAEKFTEHLSKVYRYVLENKDNELVKLTTELDFLDAYIFLLNIRFMGKVAIHIEIPEAMKSCLVIPLAMQLLIENAIKHNAMSKKSPLVIDVFIDDDHFLNIINNLQEREAHLTSTGVGLQNIRNRYLLLNNTAPEFEKTGTHFIARIPLICDSNG